MGNNKISYRQILIILVLFRVTMSISYMPSINFPPNNQDAWIGVLLSFFYVVPMAGPLLFLGNKFNDMDVIEYLEFIFGKILGKTIGFLYGLYFFFYSIILVVYQVQLTGVNILSNTANWVMISILMLVAIYIVYQGIISIFWSIELIASISFIIIITLIVLGFKQLDMKLLLPILKDSSLADMNKGSFMSSLIFVDNIVLAMAIPYLENKKHINKTFLKSVVYSLIFVTITTIVTQTSLGIEQSQHLNYPFLIYTRLINYGSIFERIDSIYIVTWISVYIGKIAMYILLTYISFKKVFNLKQKNILIIGIALAIGVISNYIASNKLITIDPGMLNKILTVSAIFTIIIPSIVCIIYFLRRKSINEKLEKMNT